MKSVGELISSGEWLEKIITPKGEILSSDPAFGKAKEAFLANSPETKAWALVSYRKEQ